MTSRLLTVSRAARLVGVSRGTLQRKIRDGELPTFEGMVQAGDVLRLFPHTDFDQDAEFERVTRIKATAFARRVRERLLPDAEVLAERLHDLGEELARTRARAEHFYSLLERLAAELDGVERTAGGDTAHAVRALRKWLRQELRQRDADPDRYAPFAVEDSLLRIMEAHVRVLPGGSDFFVEGADAILDAALGSGLALDYGCTDGSCGRCKAKIVSGRVKQIRTPARLLNDAEVDEGYVLLCCHTAVTDLVIQAREATRVEDIPVRQVEAQVRREWRPREDICIVEVRNPPHACLRFLAGQEVELDLGAGLVRRCPVASCPCEPRDLQFHLRRRSDDPFSDQVFHRLRPGDPVRLEGPAGRFVLDRDSPRSLIFFAWETGFAPIKGLIEHAMASQVAETLHLYWVATQEGGQYMDNLCRAWADALDNFDYTPLVAGRNPQDLIRIIARAHADLENYDVYVAGPGAVVRSARSALPELGLPEAQLHAYSTD